MARNKKYNSIPRNGLVGEWLLNGNALDTNNGTKNNGTATNVTYVNTERGYQKQAGSFNGSSSVVTAVGTTGIGNRTISLNIDISTLNSLTMIYSEGAMSNNNSWSVYVGNDNNIRGGIYGGATEIISNIKTGKHHILIEYNGSQISLYIDNILIGSISASLNVSNTNIGIGRWSSVSSYFFNGVIQGVRKYNRILSSSEKQNLYQEGLRQLGAGSDSILASAVAYYDFNGNANDIIGGNNGTVTGATLTTDRFGIANRAYSFDGVNDYINTSLYKLCNDSFSINFWIKVNGTSDDYASPVSFFNSTNYLGITMQIRTSGAYGFIANGINTGDFSPGVTISEWHMVTMVNTATESKFYINGNLLKTNTGTYSTNTNNNLVIGKTYPNLSQDYFNGVLSNIVILKALSIDEVKELYNLSKVKYIYPFKKQLPLNLKEGLVFWGSGDNSGTSYLDASGNGNNGTMVNSPIISRVGQHKQTSFNGSNQYISLTGGYVGTGNRTVSLRANIKTLNNNVVLFSEGGNSLNNQWGIKCHITTGYIGTYIFQGNENTSTINIGLHHIVMKYNGTHIMLYIDGVFISQVTASLNINNTIREIGRIAIVNDLYFNGSILNPKIRNRALSDIEIQEDFYSNYIN